MIRKKCDESFLLLTHNQKIFSWTNISRSKMALASLLGVSELERGRGGEGERGEKKDVVSMQSLEGKYIFLYFPSSTSSSLSQSMASFLTNLNERRGREGEGEKREVGVVVVHSHSEEEKEKANLTDAHASQWPVFPCEKREERERLRERVKVGGLPAVVLVSPEGDVITNKARSWLKYSSSSVDDAHFTLTHFLTHSHSHTYSHTCNSSHTPLHKLALLCELFLSLYFLSSPPSSGWMRTAMTSPGPSRPSPHYSVHTHTHTHTRTHR